MFRYRLCLGRLALWVALPMARTAQVESRLHMILKPQQDRRTLTRRAVVGSLAVAALGVGTLAALKPEARAQSDATAKPTLWKQTLPNGTTVELLGVSYPRLSHTVWWKPNGTPLAGQPFGPPTFISVTGQDQRVFDMRITPPSGQRPKEYNLFAQYEVPGAASVRVDYAMTSSNSLRMRGLDVVSAGADTLPTLGTVRCGVAAGPWQTYTARSVSDLWGWGENAGQPVHRRGGTLLFSRLSEIGGNVAITITDTFSGIERRVVAVDAQGHSHYDSYGGGGSQTKEMRQSTSIFKGLPLKSVRAVKFQARPYQWAEFKEITLRPGKK